MNYMCRFPPNPSLTICSPRKIMRSNALSSRAFNIESLKKRLVNTPATTNQIIEKLTQKGHAADEIVDIVEELTVEGFLDDRRYVRDAIYSNQQNRKVSARALRDKLIRKGIPEYIIGEELSAAEVTGGDVENAKALAEKHLALELERYSHPSWTVEKALQRIYGKLARQGYDEETIVAALDGAAKHLKTDYQQ